VAGHSARRYCRIVIIIAAASDDDDGDGDGDDGDDERVAQPLAGCLLVSVLLRYRAEFIILCRATLRVRLGSKGATMFSAGFSSHQGVARQRRSLAAARPGEKYRLVWERERERELEKYALARQVSRVNREREREGGGEGY